MMIISSFIHVFDDNRVWNALTKEFLELSVSDINFIKKFKNRIINEEIPSSLRNGGIVTTKDEELQLIKHLKDITKDNQFQSLYLIVSTDCNLDCDYCFYRSNSSNSLKEKKNMSLEIAIKALSDFKKITSSNLKDEFYWEQITFYGGEPLLNKELLYFAIPYARNLFGDTTNIVINTNAVFIDDKDIDLFKKYNVEVQVSIDGKKEEHDLHRKTKNGQPTYDIVINKIKKMLSNGIKVLPMVTATEDNLENFSDLLYDIVSELGISDYAVNILISDSFKISSNYADKLAQEMLKAFRSFGNLANDYAFVELYNRLIGKDKTISKSSCGSARKITVFPDGRIFACQAMEKVGINKISVLSDNYADSKNWDCWRNRSRFDNQECINCESVISCGGGCATGSFNVNNSIDGIDKNNCDYTRALFKKIHSI